MDLLDELLTIRVYLTELIRDSDREIATARSLGFVADPGLHTGVRMGLSRALELIDDAIERAKEVREEE